MRALPYAPLVCGVLFVAFLLWRKDDQPAMAWVAFVGASGLLILFILIDTGRLDDVPGFRAGQDVYQIERRLERVERDLLGYETEYFSRRDVQEKTLSRHSNGNDWYKFETTFLLEHAAIPDSVILWENDAPMSPARFSVKGNAVTVRSGGDLRHFERPLDDKPEVPPYVIRYLRVPEAAGRGSAD